MNRRENPGDDDVVVLSSDVELYSALALAESFRVSRPSVGVILLRRRQDMDVSVLHDALRAGIRAVVDERDLHAVTTAVRRARAVAQAMRERNARSGSSRNESLGPPAES